jgi:hypothetical protein
MQTTVLADAWGLWRRHRALLLPAAAPFLFLPAFAVQLLVTPPPPLPADRDRAAAEAWAEAFVGWLGGQGGWYLLAQLVALVGAASIDALLIGGLPVGRAIAAGARALPRLVLAMLVTGPPVLVGLALWLVPGFYAMARLVLVGPAIVIERRGVAAAIGASVRRTRGHGLPLTFAVGAPFLAGWLASEPLLMLARWLGEGAANPVAIVLADAGIAVIAFTTALAQALIAVAAYRRLAAR